MLQKIKTVLQALSRTEIFFCALLWLMFLLLVGTLAQKDVGLYLAQQKYFSAWVLWLGGVLPTPGGMLTFMLITVNLAAKLVLETWHLRKIGTLITHLGALTLLLGGGITSFTSQEGNIALKEGQTATFMADYYQLELALTHIQTGEDVWKIPESQLKNGATFSHKNPLFTLDIQTYCRNCSLNRLAETREEGAHGVALNFDLTPQPLEQEYERNQAGMLFTLSNAGEEDGLYGVLQHMPIPQTYVWEGQDYLLSLRHVRTPLPFSVKLLNFEKQTHVGTAMAKRYMSQVVVAENGVSWPAKIEMNQPLRYKGYTLYQASFVEENGEQISVLAVVKNSGRLFPYIASSVLALGLLVHLFMRLPILLKGKKTRVLLAALLLPVSAQAASLPLETFAQIPIQHEGRVKPLETFARHWLTTFYGKEKLPTLSATAWLAESLFDAKTAYNRPLFNIANPQVVHALGLEWRQTHRYSFVEISFAIRKNMDMVNRLHNLPPAQRSPMQQQLIDVYLNSLWFFELTRSLSLLLPEFSIHVPEVAEKLNLPVHQPFSYMEMMQHKSQYLALVENIPTHTPFQDLPEEEKNLLALGNMLQLMSKDQNTRLFRITPPVWGEGEWFSPWAVLQEGGGSPKTAQLLQTWRRMAQAWQHQDAPQWKKNVAEAYTQALHLANQPHLQNRLKLETLYRTFPPFKASLAAYLLAFVAMGFGAFFAQRISWRISAMALGAGFTLHMVGLVARIYILARPPVATLYESILFVGFISVLLALVLEIRRKDGLGLFIGSVLGVALQFLGMRYAADGDSMGMLIAVLNTNFWLATHVVVITIGYGTCLIVSILGHIYLMRRWLAPKVGELQSLMKNMLAMALVAVFFTLFGTILGGIWADQSWGRFWGWDPKENGALFIVLWLVWLLHGRITKLVSPLWFAVGMVLTNVVVALAWFGVNLLGVGLHSYGFTSNIATNLALFCGLEALFAFSVLGFIHHQERKPHES